MKFDKSSLLLYAVTDRRWLHGRSLHDQVEQAILGGATFVQLREKDMEPEAFLQEAFDIRQVCAKYHVPFVIDDNVDIAQKVNADGIHVGQSDMEADTVRNRIGSDKILGVSAGTVEQAVLAEKMGADYLGVGAVFPTGSKADAEAVDLTVLKEICQAVKIPVIAIGGITKNNLLQLSGSGICGVAVISAIFAQENVREASSQLHTLCEEMLHA